MKHEMRDPYVEALLTSLDDLTIPEGEKEVIRTIIRSGRECDVVRSDNRRERGTMVGIGRDGRIEIVVEGEDGKNPLIKRPRIGTFLSWQQKH